MAELDNRSPPLYRGLADGRKYREVMMIENFDELKKQLSQLSTVINSFKSEAVQLRLVELIFGGIDDADDSHDGGEHTPPKKRRSNTTRKKAKSKPTGKSKKQSDSASGKKKTSRRVGAATILDELIEEDFFKKPKVIKDIIDHADSAKARRFKANELSGPLNRFTRNKRLKRVTTPAPII
jgi:hypothetical protein